MVDGVERTGRGRRRGRRTGLGHLDAAVRCREDAVTHDEPLGHLDAAVRCREDAMTHDEPLGHLGVGRPLADTGFVVPFIGESREHHAALDATGVAYVEIFGRLHARSRRPRDQRRLDALAEQHAARLDAARATKVARCSDPQARVVDIGDSTG